MSMRSHLLVCIIAGVSALYEKEAGHADWKIALIGKPIGIVDAPSTGSIIVASTEGVIASLRAADGVLSWKSSPYFLRHGITGISVENDVIFVSFFGTDSLSLDLKTGGILPDRNMSIIPASLRLDPVYVGNLEVYVLPGDMIVADDREASIRVWTREEALASVSSVMMSTDMIVVHSKSTSRLIALSMQGDVLWALFVPEQVVFETTNGHLVSELDNSCVNRVELTTGELLPCERRKPSVDEHQYRVDMFTGVLTGFVSEQISWRVNLRAPILQLVQPVHTEFGSVPVLVKSDASVVWKYMNPNMIVVVQAGEMGVTLTGIDTVTGALPFQVALPGAKAPVHAVLCDNWLVMTYNENVVSIDLFENREDSFSLWNFIMGKFRFDQQAIDKLARPVVKIQEYVWGGSPISSIGVTATLKGVTPRQVLFGTNRGVLAVRKDVWLNTQRGEEISLPQYTALLPEMATDVVSYTLAFERIDQILSFPTKLESTSVVCVFGSDLFCAPVYIGTAPYDVLSPFFNYNLLYVSVGLVAALLVVSSVLVKRKVLFDKWK